MNYEPSAASHAVICEGGSDTLFLLIVCGLAVMFAGTITLAALAHAAARRKPSAIGHLPSAIDHRWYCPTAPSPCASTSPLPAPSSPLAPTPTPQPTGTPSTGLRSPQVIPLARRPARQGLFFRVFRVFRGQNSGFTVTADARHMLRLTPLTPRS